MHPLAAFKSSHSEELSTILQCAAFFTLFSLFLNFGMKLTLLRLRYYWTFTVLFAIGNVVALFGLVPAVFYRRNRLRVLISGGISYVSYLLGVKFRIKNEHIFKDMKTKPAVIVANHQSLLDLLGIHFIYRKIGKFSILSRRTLLSTPYGLFYWLMNMLITVNRRDAASRAEALRTCTSFVKDNNAKVFIFPEGTRNEFSRNTLLLPFRKGAFRMAIELQVPIMPVVFSPINFIDYQTKEMRSGEIKIVALEPIPTVGLSLNDVDEFTNRVRWVMQTELEGLIFKKSKAVEEAGDSGNTVRRDSSRSRTGLSDAWSPRKSISEL